jgi:hypothetical protein
VEQILHLVHVAQYYKFTKKRDEFLKDHKQDLDFDDFYEFFKRIFFFTESSKFDKIREKINISQKDILRYLSKEETSAFKNKTYKEIFESVEKIANAESFLDRAGDAIEYKSDVGNLNPIGSEIKPSIIKKQEEKLEKQLVQPLPDEPIKKEEPVVKAKKEELPVEEEEVKKEVHEPAVQQKEAEVTPAEEDKHVPHGGRRGNRGGETHHSNEEGEGHGHKRHEQHEHQHEGGEHHVPHKHTSGRKQKSDD